MRTGSYERAIIENPNLFEGKTVLDVGCGTGVLAMFAAKAGAAKVVAVDSSDIIVHARKNVANNNLSDTVTLVRGKIEPMVEAIARIEGE